MMQCPAVDHLAAQLRSQESQRLVRCRAARVHCRAVQRRLQAHSERLALTLQRLTHLLGSPEQLAKPEKVVSLQSTLTLKPAS